MSVLPSTLAVYIVCSSLLGEQNIYTNYIDSMNNTTNIYRYIHTDIYTNIYFTTYEYNIHNYHIYNRESLQPKQYITT